MTIKDVVTKNFTFDPQQKDFVEKLEATSECFRADLPKGVNKRKYFIYLSLLYEPQSEFRRTISVLPQLKVMCALTAGFELKPPENKFSEDVESVLVGASLVAARMAGEYCLLTQGMNMALYSFYSRVFVELVALSHQKDKIKDIVTIISKVKAETESLEKKIFAGDETTQMRKMLYLTSKSINLGLDMESIIERMAKGDDLAEFNPYPENYKPQKITYAGETEEQV